MKLFSFLFFRRPQSLAEEHSTSVSMTWKSQTSFELTDHIFKPTTGWILRCKIIGPRWYNSERPLKKKELDRPGSIESNYYADRSLKAILSYVKELR